MTPGDIISPNAPIYEIPCEEWLLDFTQSATLTAFQRDYPQRTVRRFKGDSVPYWAIECGDVTIIELALLTAVRKARETR